MTRPSDKDPRPSSKEEIAFFKRSGLTLEEARGTIFAPCFEPKKRHQS